MLPNNGVLSAQVVQFFLQRLLKEALRNARGSKIDLRQKTKTSISEIKSSVKDNFFVFSGLFTQRILSSLENYLKFMNQDLRKMSHLQDKLLRENDTLVKDLDGIEVFLKELFYGPKQLLKYKIN